MEPARGGVGGRPSHGPGRHAPSADLGAGHPAHGVGWRLGLQALLLLLFLPFEWILVATIASCRGLKGLSISRGSVTLSSLRAYGDTRWTAGLRNGSSALPNVFIKVWFAMEYAGEKVQSAPQWIGFLRPGGTAQLGWDLVLRRRGVAVVSQLIAENVLPGSLLKSRRVFDVAHRVDVLPLLYDLAPGVSDLLTGRRYAPSSRVHLVPAGAEELVDPDPCRPGTIRDSSTTPSRSACRSFRMISSCGSSRIRARSMSA